MTKGNAVQYWCSDVPINISLKPVKTTSKLNICKRSYRFKKAIVSSGSMIVVSTRELGPWGTEYWPVAVVGDWAMSVRLAIQISQTCAHA